MKSVLEMVAGRTPRNPSVVRQNFDAVALMVFAVIGGTAQLVTLTTAPSINDVLGFYLGLFWAGSLVFWGAVSLVGMFMRLGLIALLLERAGRGTLGFSAYIYGVAICVHSGVSGATAACLVFAFGTACFFRAIVITVWIRLLAEGTKEHAD